MTMGKGLEAILRAPGNLKRAESDEVTTDEVGTGRVNTGAVATKEGGAAEVTTGKVATAGVHTDEVATKEKITAEVMKVLMKIGSLRISYLAQAMSMVWIFSRNSLNSSFVVFFPRFLRAQGNRDTGDISNRQCVLWSLVGNTGRSLVCL